MWYQFQRLVPNDATLCAACTNSLTGYGCSAQTLLETPSAQGRGPRGAVARNGPVGVGAGVARRRGVAED